MSDREELLRIKEATPNLDKLPEGADAGLVKCVTLRYIALFLQRPHCMLQPTIPTPHIPKTPNPKQQNREMEELTFYDAGPKPDWALKETKPAGAFPPPARAPSGPAGFLRPGALLFLLLRFCVVLCTRPS
jgi:hypothetical protein